MAPQFEVVIDCRFVARLDVAVPGLRLGFEVDGYTYHARRDRFERDHERAAELVAAGWQLVPLTPTQLTGRRAWVGRTMLEVVQRARPRQR